MSFICRASAKIKRIIVKKSNEILLKKQKVSFENSITINGRITVSCEIMNEKVLSYPTISIGKNVKINSGKKYNLIGGSDGTILRTVDKGRIYIGDGVAMSNTSIVSFCEIRIEDNVMIGGDVRIYDTDFHSLNYEQRIEYPDYNIVSRPVMIKKGAFIGAGALILKGVTIGERSIVGAGAVVTKDIPAGEIWGGNPARFIRKTGND